MQILDELEPTRARAVRRHGRLLRPARRHGPGDHDPHAGVRGRPLQLPGGRWHRRRQRPGGRARRDPREERGDCSRRSRRRRPGCERATPAHRQLRFLHLQPGAGVRGAGRIGLGAPQRRRVGAGGARLAADAPVHLARPRHARRVGHQPRTDPRLQRADPGARRLPRPPGDRRRVRRRGRARRAADARQDLRARALRHRPVRGPAPVLRRRALPLADRTRRCASRRPRP